MSTATARREATPKQVSFYRSLLNDWDALAQQVDGDNPKRGDFIEQEFYDFQAKSVGDASKAIDHLINRNRELRAQVREANWAQERHDAAGDDEALLGWYQLSDSSTELRLVKKTRAGHIVGYDVTLSADGRQIDYLGKRGLVGLKPEEKMTGDELGDLVKLLGFSYCIECGRQLTDPESIDRGIGPICAAKY